MKMPQTSITVVMRTVPRVTFEEALDGMFKCPSCQDVLNIKKNEKSRKGLFQRKLMK